MAGAGVSVGSGAGMLRARRRDVSVKPNRKLDRKSSRGMIYENEELRLRTIHINAEVEQGQNDIKKLRRENEQLRREIWSLRDEYDKLEEILKRQKSRGESDDSEDRSEKDDEERSNCSCEQEDRALDSHDEEEQAEEEDVEEEEEEEEGRSSKNEDDRTEQLENAENRRISSEKMNGGGNHRLLHVDFDDLSVVDEEEELKKEREKKETTTCHDHTHNETSKSQQQQQQQNIAKIARRLQDNVPFYPGTYHSSSGGYPAPPYFAECPFDLGNCTESPQHASTVLPSPCPALYSDTQVQLGDLDPPMNLNEEALLPQLHVPPLEWQQADAIAEESLVGASYPIDAPPTIPLLEAASPVEYENYVDAATAAAPKYRVFKAFDKTRPYDIPGRREPPLNGWQGVEPSDRTVAQEDATAIWPDSEKRRHFFAPLSSKTRKQTEEESPTASANYFGTGTSSSSGRTTSTVVSRSNPFFLPGQKGCVDVCVNGAVSYGKESRLDGSAGNFARDNKEEQRTFLSTDNLLIDGVKRMSGCEQPVKSLSWQDLSGETQSAVSEGLAKPSSMTKSDNTLDSISNGNSVRPYRSHLNVTLKIPRHERAIKESQAIGQSQAQGRRVLQRNPFLQDFQQTSPLTQPLSVRVNETSQLPYDYPVSPVARTLRSQETSLHRPTMETYPRRSGKRPEENRLLIPSDRLTADFQVTSFERPSPRAIVPSSVPYDFSDALRTITGNRYLHGEKAYRRNALPFVPFAPPPTLCPQFATLPTFRPHEAIVRKVAAQTQTSIDGDSHAEEEGVAATLSSPSSERRKRPVKKEKEEKALSPRALRKLKKQSSSATSSDRPDSPGKCARQRARKQSLTATTTASEGQEEKNESRSSSSGQDSPRKDQTRRTSTYFNAKQRPSLTSIKTARSGSLDVPKDNKYFDASAGSNCDKEGVAIAATKNRKSSTSSASVPWCACWGNGCM